MEPVYLDHHATTPCDPRVVEAMLPYFDRIFGNPAAISSPHGQAAARAVDDARNRIAQLLQVDRTEVIFTSGATESNHLALSWLAGRRDVHVITTSLEHSSLLAPLAALPGVSMDVLDPEPDGVIAVESVAAAIRPETVLVSVTAANGEIGTIQPLPAIAAVCRERGVVLHTDATQAVGKIAPDEPLFGASLLSLSAHKFYGPKGIGALIARRGHRLTPWTRGGGQERGVRSGTVNVPGVMGLACALELRAEEQAEEGRRLEALRTAVLADLRQRLPGIRVHGSLTERLPGNLCVSLPGVEADGVILALRHFSISAGSACATRERAPSKALKSIGLGDRECLEAFRIGMGRSTTVEQMELFAAELQQVIESLRRQSL